MPALNLLLSHHRDGEIDRCVRIGGVAVCARCLALYPTLALAFVAPPLGAIDRIAAAVLPLPAVVDWAASRLGRARGTNATRLLTGALAGVGFGRGALGWAHGDPFVFGVLGAIGVAALGVQILSRRRALKP